MPDIRVFNSHIEITPYKQGDYPVIEKQMSKYDSVTHKSIPVGFYIEGDTLYLPRGINTSQLQLYFNSIPIPVTKCDDYTKFRGGNALFPPKNTIQENAIKFLTSSDDYAYTARYSQFGLNLDTGDGKTYSTVSAIMKLKIRSMIITHQDKLKLQWYKTFTDMTDFPEKRILNISGVDVMEDIMKNKYKDIDIFLVNHQTLASYARDYGWKSLHEFFIKIKIGIKVIDEAHKFFENIFMIDCFSNVYKTFYLTATFGRSDASEVSIYKKAFSSLVRYGEETINYEEKRKHIKFCVVYFNSKPEYQIVPSVRTRYGFSSYKYIDYELHKDENKSLKKVLFKILDQTKHLNGKTLIIAPKTESVEEIADLVRDNFGYDVGTVHSKNSPEVNQENLNKNVICSTVKSIGEGVDIKGLRVLINLEPIGSKNLADQVRGRLREYSKEDDTFLFYPVDMMINECYMLLKRIMPTMKKKCKEIIFLKMDV